MSEKAHSTSSIVSEPDVRKPDVREPVVSEPDVGEPEFLHPKHATTIHIAINNSDFVVVFAQMTPLFGQQGLVKSGNLEPLAAISLAPMTAKQLMNGLSKAIENFEYRTGVPIPDMGSFSVTDI